MKFNILVAFFMIDLLSTSQILQSQKCLCNQLYTETDCKRKQECHWSQISTTCTLIESEVKAIARNITYTKNNNQQIPIQSGISLYCNSIQSASQCQSSFACSWSEQKCSHFTSCSAYSLQSEDECLSLSSRCTSNGNQCIEKNNCNNHKTAQSCKINQEGKYCFWDQSDPSNIKCEDLKNCSQIPTSLTNDEQCRSQLSYCTAKIDGGCIESGENCSDQISEISCVTNRLGNIKCIWKENQCFDRTCENAPQSLTTDQECQDYLSICTTKQDGGCTQKNQCSDALIEAACITDINNNYCQWDGISCNNRQCQDALQTYQTNQQCSQFLSGCITTGNGCIQNTGCEAALVQQACDKTLTGILCHWDGLQCVNKTCENAGPLYIGHNACNDFMPKCTAKVNASSGCMQISCVSAPIMYNTDELCKSYLPNYHCTTKNGGGCRLNTKCEEIDVEIDCVKDYKGKECFWNEGVCQQRICKNAPKTFTTHEQCQNYSQQCTATNNKCVDMYCEKISHQQHCIRDLNNNPCHFNNKCRLKQCTLADKKIRTYEDCQKYLDTCTLDNSGFGCIDLPTDCQSILIPQACKKTLNGQICGWDGNNCIDYNCYTATNDFDSTEKCQQYKQECVVNNDLNGCMDLPENCQDRKQKDNCEIDNESNVKCQWDEINSICLDIKCENAHFVTLLNNVTQEGCWNFYGLKCIINNTLDKCIERPNSCDGLAETACIWENILIDNSQCYWDVASQTCKVFACSSITFLQDQIIDHYSCNDIMSQCTVDYYLQGCINLGLCYYYNIIEQCVVDEENVPCIWLNFYCDYKNCANAPENSDYNSESECATYSNQCTINQTKCLLKKTSCIEYSDQINCEQNTLSGQSQCVWQDQKCIEQQYNCSLIKGTELNPQYCNQKSLNCSVNRSQTQCIREKNLCESYKTKENCFWASMEGYCLWTNSKCMPDCTKLTDSNLDFDYCFYKSFQCTVKLDGSACVQMGATCSDNPLTSCTKAKDGNFCYVKKGTTNTCVAQTTVLQSGNCSTVTGTRLTAFYCNTISKGECTVNAALTSCISIKLNCSGYTGAGNCNISKNGQCTYKNGVCQALILDEQVCDNIKLHGYTVYTDYICQMKDSSCIAKADNSGCVAGDITQKFCKSFTGTDLTDNFCAGQSISCIANKSKTSCIQQQYYCQDYSLDDCYISISQGECTIENGYCIQKQCNDAPITITTMDECKAYSLNCLLRQGGCQLRVFCKQYYVEGACFSDYFGNECLWNPQNKQCVYKLCKYAENSIYFDSDEECSKIGNCTVNFINDSIGGCISRTSCDQYLIKEQCYFDHMNEKCFWSEYYQICSYKQCITAPLTINNHQQCMEYYPDCTVNIIYQKPQGCMELKLCNQYISAEQCLISSMKDENNKNIICGWNGYSCKDKSCYTAKKEINTPQLCSSYFPGCTVNKTKNGCIEIPLLCELMIKEQCFSGSFDFNNQKCMWLDDQYQCITKTCENAIHADSNEQCEDHLQICTQTPFKCLSGQAKQCTDFMYQTDFECKSVIPNIDCTTNGQNCVLRISCSHVVNQAGCTFDNQGNDCEWVTHHREQSYCALKTCETAPRSLRTEEACKNYYPFSDGQICTTKRNGGCTIKQSCKDLTIESICKIDAQGKQCVWDVDAQQCRFPGCKDLIGNSIEECQLQDTNCTLGLNGRCTQMTICENIRLKQACVFGTNGTCIWIGGYINDDKSQGACFQYDSCKSLKWKTDQQCKLISPLCTTNGLECVGITKCSETNTSGGCIFGTDGLCVQTLIKVGNTDLVCKKFTTCNEVYYLTHEECQRANFNCTSDNVKGCIPLSKCQSYLTYDSCRINDLGIGKDQDNLIVSTGNCVWDKILNYCRDEQCLDIQKSTEIECSSKLSYCTSDGKMCLLKGKCSNYQSENACSNAGGTDGPCIWIPAKTTNSGLCRIKVCAEIQNGSSQEICSILKDCISDGQNCINKAKCSSYLTQISCQQVGLDDVCFWMQSANDYQGKCHKLTACLDAKDQFKCNQVKDRCYWLGEKNICQDHTCETYYLQEKKCSYFFVWNKQSYNICLFNQGKCVSSDVQSLTQDNCYSLSGEQYSWNPYLQKCIKCEKVLNNEPQDINNSINSLDEKKIKLLIIYVLMIIYL